MPRDAAAPPAVVGPQVCDLGQALQGFSAAKLRQASPDVLAKLEGDLLALLKALHAAYSDVSFQAEVKALRAAADGNAQKHIMLLAPVASRVQDPIFKSFGLPTGQHGVVLMKAAVKALAERSQELRQLSGDLRELLGLDREEVYQPLFQGRGAEDPWVARAAKFRETARQRVAELERRSKAPEVSESFIPARGREEWRPAGTPTFFPAPGVELPTKAPMGRPPELFPSGSPMDRSFASPAALVTDRYEMSLWLARSLCSYSMSLGEEASCRLFEGDAAPRGSAGAIAGGAGGGAPAARLRTVYIAGVEGTGHHGLGPLLMYPAVCRYGESTLAWWRSLREVLMKTAPRERRARLRSLMAGMRVQEREHILFEWASWPFGEDGRERWAGGCEDPEALARELKSGNPGNSVDLQEFVELFQEYGDVRILVLHRNLAAAAWSHKDWDEGLVEHARILALFTEYLTGVLRKLQPDTWRWVAYEDICQAHQAGRFDALDPLADFLGLPPASLQKAFRCFRPSRKEAAAEMPASALAAICDLEGRLANGWFPAVFPEQQLLPGAASAAAAPAAAVAAAEAAAAFNQKLAVLLKTMTKEQLALWEEANSGGGGDAGKAKRLESLLSEDQRFLLAKAAHTEKLLKVLEGAKVEPSRHTCVHMWIEDRGFGSEINNLVSAMVFCQENCLDCVVEDEGWNSGRLADYLEAEPWILGRCRRGEGCRALEVKRNKQVATPGWFGVCRHALAVPFAAKAEATRRVWRLTAAAREAVEALNKELRLPGCFLAVQIRRGDKVSQPSGQRGGETLPIDLEEYASRALEHFSPPCTAVVVCSDDASATEEFARLVQRQRPHVEVRRRRQRQAPEQLRNGHWQKAWNDLPLARRRALTHEFLADVEVMRTAHTVVCTHSSNVARLVAQLRGGLRVHSLDEEWTNS